MTSFTSMRAAAITLGACAALSACAKKDATTDTTAMGASSSSTTTTTAGGAMAGDSTKMAGGANNGANNGANANANAKPMADADIVANITAANQGEIAAGDIAKTKATNADVKAFAQDMVKDHSSMLNSGKKLASTAKISPNGAAADSVAQANKTMATQLGSTAKGAAFDKAYIDGQVTAHQNTLSFLQAAAGSAQNADLKSMITGAIPDVQKHLDRAKQLQSKMGGTAM